MLLAAYSFDEVGSTVVDYSGNGHDWELNNGAERAAGHTGGGITRDGAGDLPVLAEPAIGETAQRTVMFWQQGLGDSVWWIRWTAGADVARWGIYGLSGQLRARMVTDTGTTNAGPATAPTDGLAHHYAATYDGANVRLFIDGVQVAIGARTGTPAPSDRIDIMEHTVPSFAMDDLRLFDEALDAAAITAWSLTPVAPIDEGQHTASAIELPLSLGLTGDGAKGTMTEVALPLTLGLDGLGAKHHHADVELPVETGLDVAAASARASGVSLPIAFGLTLAAATARGSTIELGLAVGLEAHETVVAEPIKGRVMPYAYGYTVTVKRPGGRDRYGNPLPGTEHTIDECVWAPRSSVEENDSRATTIVGLTMYGPYGSDIASTDQVELPGDDVPWYVEGDPGEWTNPFTGEPAGFEVNLTRTRG